jgi:hypothetical protein
MWYFILIMTNALIEIGPPTIFVDPEDDGKGFGGTRALFREAARQFNVDLSKQEDYDWLAQFGACMLIDHLVDVEKTDLPFFFKNIMSGNIRDDLNPDVQIRAINYMERLTPEVRGRIFSQVAEVNELVTAQRSASKAKEVVDIRISEADIFTSVVALEETDGIDESARKSFNTWLLGASRAAYLMDTMFDMRQDYENGETSVKPSTVARLQYTHAAVQEGLFALKRTPASLVGKSALVAVNYVMKQRRLDVTKQGEF